MHKSANINFLHATQLFNKPNTPFFFVLFCDYICTKDGQNSITLIELRHKRLTFFQTAYCKNKHSVEILFLSRLIQHIILPTHYCYQHIQFKFCMNQSLIQQPVRVFIAIKLISIDGG